MERFTGVLGILSILSVCFLFSTHRKRIRPSIVAWGLGLQFTFAFLVLRTPVKYWFESVSSAVNALLSYSAAGSKFVFGEQLGRSQRTIFAFQVLPIIIFISSLFAILY